MTPLQFPLRQSLFTWHMLPAAQSEHCTKPQPYTEQHTSHEFIMIAPTPLPSHQSHAHTIATCTCFFQLNNNPTLCNHNPTLHNQGTQPLNQHLCIPCSCNSNWTTLQAHTVSPPQSTSVSIPFFKPSSQYAAHVLLPSTITRGLQLPLSHAELNPQHFLPNPHFGH
jgi:hypothetical protein